MRRELRSVTAYPVLLGALLAASLGLAPAGCGSDEGRIKLYPMNGKVVLGDQTPEGIEVRLLNAASPSNIDAPQPFGTTDASGTYRLGTYKEGDGAPTGDYIVVLRWPEGPPGPGIPRDRLGNAFTDPAKTPFKATVPEGGGTLEPFKIDPSKIRKLTSQPAGSYDPTNPP